MPSTDDFSSRVTSTTVQVCERRRWAVRLACRMSSTNTVSRSTSDSIISCSSACCTADSPGRARVSRHSLIDASGLFSSCVTESMNTCWRRPSRISPTSDTLNSTSTLTTRMKEAMPPASSQRLAEKARVSGRFSLITRIQPISSATVISTVIELSTMGTEMERFRERGMCPRIGYAAPPRRSCSGHGQARGGEGQLVYGLARQHGKCIRDRRSDGRRTRLADAGGVAGGGQDMHLDLRHLVHAQHGVVMEVRLLHPSVLQRDGPGGGGRQAIDNGRFHLHLHHVRVHCNAAVHHAYHALHLEALVAL